LNCESYPVVILHFRGELLAADGGEFVETDLAVGLRDAPFAGGPTFEQDFLEGRVERAFFGLEDVVRQRVDALGDGVTVEFAMLEDAEEEHDQRSRWDADWGFRHIQSIPSYAMYDKEVP